MDRPTTFVFIFCAAVSLDLSFGSPWTLFSVRVKRKTCVPNDEFTCTNGECIQSFNICDGTKDCSDGSDETTSVCQRLNIKCPAKTFRCKYGACIDGHKICNGFQDCVDGSDEDSDTCPGAPKPTVGGTCDSDKFKCNSGQCIDEFSLCDGEKNCDDGSDETLAVCSLISCPKHTYRCSYGACIESQRACDGVVDCADGSDEEFPGCNNKLVPSSQTTPPSLVPASNRPTASSVNGGCILPEPPTHGFYSSTLCPHNDNSAPGCKQVPGTTVARSWVLKFECNPGYELPENYLYAICVDGKWSPFLPNCTKLCPKLVSLSVRVTCTYKGGVINCGHPMPPGTRAKGECNINYRLTYPLPYSEIVCQDDGTWNENLFYCTPACGIANHHDAESLILYGTPSKAGEYPWNAGLYRKNENGNWEQNCGGTLINPHLVLTAAHCVYDENIKEIVVTTEIKIALGKFFRDWSVKENGDERQDVREIVVPPLYEGKKSSYAQDIALIDLSFSVRITNFVMPACIDWELKFEIRPGMLGTLTGWGKTENDQPSPFLLTAKLPYVDRNKCRSEVPESFQRYITPDKFCAGYRNGTRASNGDSGSGLTFVHEGLYRVYGVVSTTVKNQNTYATYTNVTNVELIKWLEDEQRRLNREHPEK